MRPREQSELAFVVWAFPVVNYGTEGSRALAAAVSTTTHANQNPADDDRKKARHETTEKCDAKQPREFIKKNRRLLNGTFYGGGCGFCSVSLI